MIKKFENFMNENSINEDRNKAVKLLEDLREAGISDAKILEHIIYNFLDGSVATEAMEDAKNEFLS